MNSPLKSRSAIGGLIAIFILLAGVASARAQFTSGFGYLPERYVVIRTLPVTDYDVYSAAPPPPAPYCDEYSSPRAAYYLYDYVNRASALTPEPIWRSMFPGAIARIQAERREFGTAGQSAGEVLYFRSYRRAR